MKTRKLLLSVIAVFLCVIFAAEPVLAANEANVGEEVEFSAGSETGGSGGSGYTDTRTEEERQADSNNQTANNEITRIAYEIIEKMTTDENTKLFEPTTIYAKDEDSYVFVYEEFIAKSKIDEMQQYIRMYKPGPKEYEIVRDYDDTDTKWNPDIPLPYDPMEILGDKVVSSEQGPISEKDKKPLIALRPIPGLGEWLERQIILHNLKTIYGGDWIRQTIEGETIEYHIPGIPSIMDFDTMMKRYEAMNYYLSLRGENIKLQYIVQYQVYDTTVAAMRTRTPVAWPGTGMTHFWEIRCLDSETEGLTVPTLQTFGLKDWKQKFYYAGTYNVQATQNIKRTFWDAMSYSKCEYLVIAETGQVIWKNEQKGGTFYESKPMDGYWPTNRININHAYTDHVYTVTYNENWHASDILIGGYKAPTAWGDENTSVRIE